MPPADQGWQRKIRQIARRQPFKQPCILIAFMAYVEQEGSKRQQFPSNKLRQ